MQRPVHLSFGRVKPIVGRWKYQWTGGGWVKKEGAKNVVQTIDIVNYALKMGVVCVCFCSLFPVMKHISIYNIIYVYVIYQ